MLRLIELINALNRIQLQHDFRGWWTVTLIQAIAAVIATPLAIGLLSQLP